jgi:hypothetical protein
MANPITQKSLGVDTALGLEKVIRVVRINIDSERDMILVGYKVVAISPTGQDVAIVKEGAYLREGVKFNELQQSTLGVSIKGMIDLDLDGIQSIDTMSEDLKQKTL